MYCICFKSTKLITKIGAELHTYDRLQLQPWVVAWGSIPFVIDLLLQRVGAAERMLSVLCRSETKNFVENWSKQVSG